jgi:predicted transcriptional regulator
MFGRQLRHAAALRILLALEAKPRSTAELAELLGLSFDTTEYVIRTLIEAGLVERVRIEPTGATASTNRWIYGTCHDGWTDVKRALEDLTPRKPGD